MDYLILSEYLLATVSSMLMMCENCRSLSNGNTTVE